MLQQRLIYKSFFLYIVAVIRSQFLVIVVREKALLPPKIDQENGVTPQNFVIIILRLKYFKYVEIALGDRIPLISHLQYSLQLLAEWFIL